MAAVAVKLKLLTRKSSQQLCEESSATVAWTRSKTKKATGAYNCTIRKAMNASSVEQTERGHRSKKTEARSRPVLTLRSI